MGVKVKSRVLAVLVAMVMVMTSAACVFADAALSNAQGSNNALVTSAKTAKKTMTVKSSAKTVKYRVKGDKSWKSAKVTDGTATLKNLKTGKLYQIKSGDKTAYRWYKKAAISTAKKSGSKVKVTWKKSTGATKYVVRAKKGSTVKYFTTTSLSKSVKLGKGSWKIQVRPIKKSGKVYVGVWSKTKTVKVN